MDAVERRNPAAHDEAASLLSDLEVIAEEAGAFEDLLRRVAAIRERHAGKRTVHRTIVGNRTDAQPVVDVALLLLERGMPPEQTPLLRRAADSEMTNFANE